jgi:hypothetical protein
MVAIVNDYHSRGLIAVVIYDNPWYRLTRDIVRVAMRRWLGVPCRDVDVKFYLPKGFLLPLPSPNLVLDCNNDLTIGQAKMCWKVFCDR